jgi:predicted lipoprotein
MSIRISILVFVFSWVAFSSCKDEENNTNLDNFDRSVMLAQWADNIIIPSYTDYNNKLVALSSQLDNFQVDATENNLVALRSSYLSAYLAWQAVSFIEIGKAESLSLRNNTNIYPTDKEKILNNIGSETYNLELPSNFAAQGFPAIDYLLYGLGDTDDIIVDALAQEKYVLYLKSIVDRMNSLTAEVVEDWNTGYRDDFVANINSSASGAVDKLVNDYIFHYERFLRAGKVGIPAGVFSGNSIASAVEAPYSGVNSRQLLLTNLNAIQDFFNGKNYKSTSNGPSLDSYLDFLNTVKNGSDLSAAINQQLDIARVSIEQLQENLQLQVLEDNNKMLQAYDELQKCVVLMKVDMLQALSINVDFVDADGD